MAINSNRSSRTRSTLPQSKYLTKTTAVVATKCQLSNSRSTTTSTKIIQERNLITAASSNKATVTRNQKRPLACELSLAGTLDLPLAKAQRSCTLHQVANLLSSFFDRSLRTETNMPSQIERIMTLPSPSHLLIITFAN
jgi:hypothetical protein